MGRHRKEGPTPKAPQNQPEQQTIPVLRQIVYTQFHIDSNPLPDGQGTQLVMALPNGDLHVFNLSPESAARIGLYPGIEIPKVMLGADGEPTLTG